MSSETNTETMFQFFDRIKSEAFKRFGASIEIIYNFEDFNPIKYEKPTLNTLRKIVDSVYMTDSRVLNKNDEGIAGKSRDVDAANYRSIFYKLGTDFGYNLTMTGKQVNRHHATVIHGLKSFNQLFSVDDKRLKYAYRNVIFASKLELIQKSNGIIQHNY